MYPPPSDPAPLTGEEQAVLAAIASQEHRRDSRFADGLATGVVPSEQRRWGLVVFAVVAAVVLAPFLLSTAWLLALVAVAVLVVIPTVLVVWALHQGRVHPD